MTYRHLAAAAGLLACLSAAGCIAPTHAEDAAMVGARPAGLARNVESPAPAGLPFPSVTGDILAGTSPEILARARAAQGEALTQALAKP